MTDDELARHVADAKRAGDMIDASTVDGLLAGIERLQREVDALRTQLAAARAVRVGLVELLGDE